MGVYMLSIPTGLAVTRLLQPHTRVQSQKLTPRVNHCLGARRLHIQDLNQQQSVRIDLRSIWRHERDDLAFGLDGLVTLKSDEVNEGLAGLQFGQETEEEERRPPCRPPAPHPPHPDRVHERGERD